MMQLQYKGNVEVSSQVPKTLGRGNN